MFIDRVKELAVLEREYKRAGSSFAVIYGRRRVGKTTLVKEFINNKKAVYYLADNQGEKIQINRLKGIVAEKLSDPVLEDVEIDNWDVLFNYIARLLPTGDKLILVIDEFQYLVKTNKAIPSIIQRLWDENLKSKNIMVILMGSIVSMMYNTVLSYKSPLYGRRTSQLKLRPIRFKDFPGFFKNKSTVDLIERYAVLSGVPKYVELFDDPGTILQAIEANILDKDSFLYNEPVFILNEELSETTTYFSIMEAISKGEHKIGNIARRLQIPASHLTSFLNRLIELELVEREVPVTEKNPLKSKKGLYFIKDHFFRFWFRYVLPYKSYLEIDNIQFVSAKVKGDFNLFVSQVFEKICMEYLMDNPPSGMEIEKVGRWWNNREEIDVVALSHDHILVGECKWWEEAVGANVYRDLRRKASLLDFEGRTPIFALFAKSGFSKELRETASKEANLFLYDFSAMDV